MDEPTTDVIRELALAALRAALGPTGHTDNCAEMRAMGVKTCTRVCAKSRAAIEAITGKPLAGADWPGEFPTSVPDVCRACGQTFNFGGGYCAKCGAPYLPATDPLRPHRLHVSLTVATEEMSDVLRSLQGVAAGRQPSYNLTSPGEAEDSDQPAAGGNANDQGLVE